MPPPANSQNLLSYLYYVLFCHYAVYQENTIRSSDLGIILCPYFSAPLYMPLNLSQDNLWSFHFNNILCVPPGPHMLQIVLLSLFLHIHSPSAKLSDAVELPDMSNMASTSLRTISIFIGFMQQAVVIHAVFQRNLVLSDIFSIIQHCMSPSPAYPYQDS